jgi:2,4-dienoyl-CoA reductase-like NADH-dependent reductase (Old Yellow Enzyme family)
MKIGPAMTILFEETHINGIRLSNRFIRSATWSAMASEDGRPTPQLINLLINLAQGGVGLIITGHAYVRQDGQAGSNQLGVYSDKLIPHLGDMVQRIHDHGGKVVLQVSHAGFFARAKLEEIIPLAPSVVEDHSQATRKEMTHQDIRQIVAAFAAAALRARQAGFDGVQIHAAHGYLLSQFLSPLMNRRSDEYGGSIANRARVLLSVLEAIRKAVGSDYPVLIKLNSGDFVEGGLAVTDAAQVGCMLEHEGVDAIELSGGLLFSRQLGPVRKGIISEDREAYFQDEARAFKEMVSVPLILVGGIRSYQIAKRLLEDGVADYISMSRPFIREPNLINRWRTGDLRKSTCISENNCLTAAMEGEEIYCVTEKKKQRSLQVS